MPEPLPPPDPLPGEPPAPSGMRIDFTLSIGYTRRRPDTLGDRWEARIDSIGLLLIGALLAVLILGIVVPRIFDWLHTIGP